MLRGDLALIYLARGADGGIDTTNGFLQSYKQYAAGIPHHLIVLTKGWEDQGLSRSIDEKVRSIGGETLSLPDDGFDLGAYFRAIPIIKQTYVCFLNTHSCIIADEWLAKLYQAALQPGVGAAGSSGSWQSHLDTELMRWRRENLVYKLRHLGRIVKVAVKYDTFPNAALRTNAFVMTRDLFADFAKTHSIPRKRDLVGPLESGRKGLTAYLAKRGLQVVVVGKDGKAYSAPDWVESQTFAVPGQPNLLVSDNRTRIYDAADPATRVRLERLVWGRALTTLD